MTATAPLRIALADDQALVRAGLRALLERQGIAIALEAEEGAALLISSFDDTRDPEAVASVRAFAAESLAVLQELAKTASPEAVEAMATAATLLQSLDEQARVVCGP